MTAFKAAIERKDVIIMTKRRPHGDGMVRKRSDGRWEARIVIGHKADGNPMYHFDFYRINKLQEAVEIGLYDYLDSGCLCMMEWPENIEELLPEETLRVSITVNPDQSRTVSWED